MYFLHPFLSNHKTILDNKLHNRQQTPKTQNQNHMKYPTLSVAINNHHLPLPLPSIPPQSMLHDHRCPPTRCPPTHKCSEHLTRQRRVRIPWPCWSTHIHTRSAAIFKFIYCSDVHWTVPLSAETLVVARLIVLEDRRRFYAVAHMRATNDGWNGASLSRLLVHSSSSRYITFQSARSLSSPSARHLLQHTRSAVGPLRWSSIIVIAQKVPEAGGLSGKLWCVYVNQPRCV